MHGENNGLKLTVLSSGIRLFYSSTIPSNRSKMGFSQCEATSVSKDLGSRGVLPKLDCSTYRSFKFMKGMKSPNYEESVSIKSIFFNPALLKIHQLPDDRCFETDVDRPRIIVSSRICMSSSRWLVSLDLGSMPLIKWMMVSLRSGESQTRRAEYHR